MDESEVQVMSETSAYAKGSYIIGVQAERIDDTEYKAKWYLRVGFTIEPQINSTKYTGQFCLNPTIATAFHSIAEALDILETVKQDIKPLTGFKITAYIIECWETIKVMTIEY